MVSQLKVQDVFGQSRGVPMNYVERESVDDLFREALSSNRQVVLYGNSKQGKSSIRRHNLDSDDYIVIHCNNKWDIGRLNAQILRASGFELNTSTYKTIDGKTKVLAAFKSHTKTENSSDPLAKETFHSLELDPYDPNDIINALKLIGFNKYIVLEDFQYLLDETKTDFSIGLKTFHEHSGFTFIIVGTWNEEHKLEEFNKDLSGRIYYINTDSWTQDELHRVIIRGEKLLNISIDNSLKQDILNWSINDVFKLQEICLQVCLKNGITKAQELPIELSNDVDVFELTTNWNEHIF